jgi:hypothetical protein
MWHVPSVLIAQLLNALNVTPTITWMALTVMQMVASYTQPTYELSTFGNALVLALMECIKILGPVCV